MVEFKVYSATKVYIIPEIFNTALQLFNFSLKSMYLCVKVSSISGNNRCNYGFLSLILETFRGNR